MGGNPKMDAFFRKAKKWQREYEELRSIALSCGLDEGVKWRWPCYTLEGKNIVLIHGFKDYCALLFFKGVLLKDPKHILIQQTENVQVTRQIRFRSAGQIREMEGTLKAYIHDAIEAEKSGVKPTLKKTADFKMPEEFKKKLADMPRLKAAFAGLTPGRQRGYLYYFSQAKQAKTRDERVAKCVAQILAGKGLDE